MKFFRNLRTRTNLVLDLARSPSRPPAIEMMRGEVAHEVAAKGEFISV
jgi:hypothetical protein